MRIHLSRSDILFIFVSLLLGLGLFFDVLRADYPPEKSYASIHDLVKDIEELDGEASEGRAAEIVELFKISLELESRHRSQVGNDQFLDDILHDRIFLRSPKGRVQINQVDQNIVYEIHPRHTNKVWFFSEVSIESESLKSLIANHHLAAGSSREDGRVGRDAIFIHLAKSDSGGLSPDSCFYFPRARNLVIGGGKFWAPLPLYEIPRYVAGFDTTLFFTKQGLRDLKYSLVRGSAPTLQQFLLNGVFASLMSASILFTNVAIKNGAAMAFQEFHKPGAWTLMVGLILGTFVTGLSKYKRYGNLKDRVHKNTWFLSMYINSILYGCIHGFQWLNPLVQLSAPLIWLRLYASCFFGAFTKTHLYEMIDILKATHRSDGNVKFLEDRLNIKIQRDNFYRIAAGFSLEFLRLLDLVEAVQIGGFSFGKIVSWSMAPIIFYAKVRVAESVNYEHKNRVREEWNSFKSKVKDALTCRFWLRKFKTHFSDAS